jgi:hypothetical protein
MKPSAMLQSVPMHACRAGSAFHVTREIGPTTPQSYTNITGMETP